MIVALRCLKGGVIVALQGCVIVVLQDSAIVVLLKTTMQCT
jgi:hypothetical protein